jgi:hypothetical protein
MCQEEVIDTEEEKQAGKGVWGMWVIGPWNGCYLVQGGQGRAPLWTNIQTDVVVNHMDTQRGHSEYR